MTKARIVDRRLELHRGDRWAQVCCPYQQDATPCGKWCALFDIGKLRVFVAQVRREVEISSATLHCCKTEYECQFSPTKPVDTSVIIDAVGKAKEIAKAAITKAEGK